MLFNGIKEYFFKFNHHQAYVQNTGRSVLQTTKNSCEIRFIEVYLCNAIE